MSDSMALAGLETLLKVAEHGSWVLKQTGKQGTADLVDELSATLRTLLAERDTTEAENKEPLCPDCDMVMVCASATAERIHGLEVMHREALDRAEAAEAHLLTTEASLRAPTTEPSTVADQRDEPSEWTEQLPHAHVIAKQIILNVVKEYGDEVFIADGYEPGEDLAVWISHAICDAYMGGMLRAGTVQPQEHAKATSAGAASQIDLSTTEEAAFKAGWAMAFSRSTHLGDVDKCLTFWRQSKAGSVKP